MIVPSNHDKEGNRHRYEDECALGAFDEFRDQHDDDRDARNERVDSVDECFLRPSRAASFPPVA